MSAAPAVLVEPPPRRVRTRARFVWDAVGALALSAVMSPLVVAESARRPTAATFAKWMRPWARGVLRLWGVRQRVEHRAPLPDGPLVYVANHQNLVDIVALSAGMDRPFLYVARHELRTWPLVGWVLEKTACIFIDRTSARRSLDGLKAAAARIRGGESVVLFPEGARTYRHGTDPFARGPFLVAVEAGVPVVPVALVGHIGVMDERARVARTGEIVLVTGTPIPTDGLTRADSGALAEQVRTAVETELARWGAARPTATD